MNRTPVHSFNPLRLLGCALGLVAAMSLPAAPALADDAALYGPEAPPGSAFIRVVNATADADLEAQVGDKQIDRLAAWSASEFEYLPAGTQTVVAGSVKQSAQLQAGHYYTAVVDGERLRLLDNSAYDNRLKALVILYNLTDQSDLTLRTSDGKTTVVEPVARDAFGTREVNAARARLAVFAGDSKIGETPAVSLARGKATSVFAVGPASAPRLILATN